MAKSTGALTSEFLAVLKLDELASDIDICREHLVVTIPELPVGLFRQMNLYIHFNYKIDQGRDAREV
jgi:hypothetical protein